MVPLCSSVALSNYSISNLGQVVCTGNYVRDRNAAKCRGGSKMEQLKYRDVPRCSEMEQHVSEVLRNGAGVWKCAGVCCVRAR